MANDRVCECKLFVNFSRFLKRQTDFDDSSHFTTNIFLKKYGVSDVNFLWIFIALFIPLTLQRTNFWKILTLARINFPFILQRTFFLQKAGIQSKKFFAFTLNGQFFDRWWHRKCKFSVNFHFDFYLSHFTTDIFPSTGHPNDCKIFINSVMSLSTVQRTFFC